MDLQTTETMPVKYQGGQISLPTKFVQSLPEIVRNEITEPTAKKTTTEGRELITRRIISMLDVKFQDAHAEDMAISEFKSFIRDFDLTGREIFAAYKMAIKEELFDTTEKKIEVYPNLSLITAGKILNAYEKYKLDCKKYEAGKAQIKAFLNPPPPEPTEAEKAAQRANLRTEIERCFETFGECEYAFLIYEDLKAEGVLDDYRNPEKIQPIKNRLMAKFLQKEQTRNLFYNPVELRELSNKFSKNEKYKTPGIVVQEVKNEIIKKYYNERKNIG